MSLGDKSRRCISNLGRVVDEFGYACFGGVLVLVYLEIDLAASSFPVGEGRSGLSIGSGTL